LTNKIIILTGPVHSGKSTRLYDWAMKKKNVSGIICLIRNSKRCLVSVKDGIIKELETDNIKGNDEIVEICNYKFLENVFEWGREVILNSFNSPQEYLIIDEIGKLELEEKGLEPAISFVLNNRIKIPRTVILFVVRDKLIKQVIEHYKLSSDECEIISTDKINLF